MTDASRQKDRLEHLLNRRTRELAERGREAVAQATPIKAAILQQDSSLYAISLPEIAHVMPLEKYASLPGGRRGIIGLVSHGGEVYKILDLGSALTQAQASSSSLQRHVVILRAETMKTALLCDHVAGVADLVPVENESAQLPPFISRYLRPLADESAISPGAIAHIDIPSLISSYAMTSQELLS